MKKTGKMDKKAILKTKTEFQEVMGHISKINARIQAVNACAHRLALDPSNLSLKNHLIDARKQLAHSASKSKQIKADHEILRKVDAHPQVASHLYATLHEKVKDALQYGEQVLVQSKSLKPLIISTQKPVTTSPTPDPKPTPPHEKGKRFSP